MRLFTALIFAVVVGASAAADTLNPRGWDAVLAEADGETAAAHSWAVA